MKLIYVASPYSHRDEKVREARYQATFIIVSELTKNDDTCLYYSPIVYHHPMTKQVIFPYTADFWWRYNKIMLDKADGLLVLQQEGWDKSTGVALEIGYARGKGLTVGFY